MLLALCIGASAGKFLQNIRISPNLAEQEFDNKDSSFVFINYKNYSKNDFLITHKVNQKEYKYAPEPGIHYIFRKGEIIFNPKSAQEILFKAWILPKNRCTKNVYYMEPNQRIIIKSDYLKDYCYFTSLEGTEYIVNQEFQYPSDTGATIYSVNEESNFKNDQTYFLNEEIVLTGNGLLMEGRYTLKYSTNLTQKCNLVPIKSQTDDLTIWDEISFKCTPYGRSSWEMILTIIVIIIVFTLTFIILEWRSVIDIRKFFGFQPFESTEYVPQSPPIIQDPHDRLNIQETPEELVENAPIDILPTDQAMEI